MQNWEQYAAGNLEPRLERFGYSIDSRDTEKQHEVSRGQGIISHGHRDHNEN